MVFEIPVYLFFFFLKFMIPELQGERVLTQYPVGVHLCHSQVRLVHFFLNNRSTTLKSYTLSHSCVPQAPVSTALTTVVLDQIQMCSLYFCKILMHDLTKLHVAADGYCC